MTTTLQTSKVEFINRLNEITDRGNTGIMSDIFDIFSSSKNEFKGQINFDSFKIKRKRRFFDTNMNIAVANGFFIEDNEQLIIETEIKGFSNFFTIFYIFVFIFYLVSILAFMFNDTEKLFIVIPFILFHGTLMCAIPYFIIRRSVKRLKYELEREFFYLTKSY